MPPASSPAASSSTSAARFVIDEAGTIVETNMEACALVDVGPRMIVGKPLGLFVDRDDAATLASVLADATLVPSGDRYAPFVRVVDLFLRTRTGVRKRARATISTRDRARLFVRVEPRPTRSGVFGTPDDE